jgi:hypothetical protein
VNQLKDAPVRDNRNILILCTSVMPTSLTYARNCPICSYVVLASSLMTLARFGIRKPHGYGIVLKYSGYDFWYDLAWPLGMNPNSRKVLAICSLTPLIVSLYLWVRCHIGWCSQKKYVGNRSVWNTRTHGRYIGSVNHGLVVGLLKVMAYTRVQLCGVCRKTHVNRSGCAPRVRYASSRKKPQFTHGCAPRIR